MTRQNDATLNQDPHQPASREKVLEIAIGRAIKGFRLQQGITVSDLADRRPVQGNAVKDREWQHFTVTLHPTESRRGAQRAVDQFSSRL